MEPTITNFRRLDNDEELSSRYMKRIGWIKDFTVSMMQDAVGNARPQMIDDPAQFDMSDLRCQFAFEVDLKYSDRCEHEVEVGVVEEESYEVEVGVQCEIVFRWVGNGWEQTADFYTDYEMLVGDIWHGDSILFDKYSFTDAIKERLQQNYIASISRHLEAAE